MDGFNVCDHLFWLKGSGKFTIHGCSFEFLSFNNEWPSGVTNRATASDIPAGILDSSGSDSTVSQLVAEIKPRYHIAGNKGAFYAREPYANVDAVHVTRFLGLASVGNKEKQCLVQFPVLCLALSSFLRVHASLQGTHQRKEKKRKEDSTALYFLSGRISASTPQKVLHALSPTLSSAMSAAEISVKPPNATISPYTLADQVDRPKEATKRASDNVLDSQYWRYDVSQKHGMVMVIRPTEHGG
ncbi:zinc finger CCCH domain-containing protein 64-like isoform X2 [Durio zibethinus]|uniref:Zinc finger CCCH domain-containing protein 64-like isoform X2 n=1 Tax=Durio zibethinus TaxID=66656 RepID=A0A6P5XW70_DURZI|nr:zinc finger CCCH domain-containing protein 64-like isoform X2 [Durio zibethinus]